MITKSDSERKLGAACQILLEACQLAAEHVPWDVAIQMDLAIKNATAHMDRGCDQSGCRMSVELAHRIRTAARIAADQGYYSISDFLLRGLDGITGKKKPGAPCELSEIVRCDNADVQ